MIAIVVVAIVIVAAMGALFILNKNDDGIDIDSSLRIYGNVNEDFTINNDDVALLEKIIKEETTSEYKLADANQDGKVDEKDVELVRKMVNRDPVDVYMVDDSNVIVKISYPLKNAVAITADMLSLITAMEAGSAIAAYISSAYENEQTYITSNTSIKNLGGSARTMDATSYGNLMSVSSNLSTKGEKIGGILCYSTSSISNYKTDLEAAQIPLMQIDCTSPTGFADGALTIGWIMGEEIEKNGLEVCKKSYEIYNHVEDKIGNAKKVTCVSFSMWNYITQKKSQYTMVTQAAGGNNVVELDGDSSVKLGSPEAITAYDDVDFLVSFRSQDIVKLDSKGIVDIWDNPNNDLLTGSAAYESLVFINANIPVCVRVAYLAEIFYPNLFKGYGDKMFQDFVDDHMTYLNDLVNGKDANRKFDVKNDVTSFITYEMYLAAKAKA